MEMFALQSVQVPVPDYVGDVYLVIEDHAWPSNQVLIEQVNVIINQGPSFGLLVDGPDRQSQSCCSGFGFRIKLGGG